ncbi:MAG: prolipoprotein diacylglyceryl transferase [Terrimicrobiaceae bacterium]
MMAYYIHDLDPFILRVGETWGLRWYGMAYLLAFVVGFFIYRRLAQKGFSDLKPDQVGDFIFGGAVFGVVLGGRLGYMLFYHLDGFVADPLSFFHLSEGGMSAHGGIFGLALYSLWFARRHRVSWLNLGDNLVVVAPLGLLFGRIANFINGELYGRVATVPWAVQFPLELYDRPEMAELAVREAMTINPAWTTVDQVVGAVAGSPELREQLAVTLSPRHPSQIYEAALEGLLLFFILWFMRTRLRLRNGVLTGVFFIGYAVLRSFCELFREPDAPLTGVLTRGQFLSVFLVLVGIGFLVASWKQRVVGPESGQETAQLPSDR